MLILIKGAGDLATGVAHRLYRCGFSIVMTEVPQPTTVRCTVAFSPAVYNGQAQVEGVTARLAQTPQQALDITHEGDVAVLVDPDCACLCDLQPDAVVDAILAKENLGTHITDAPIVVAMGPGFTAGVDCHAVVETKRGHTLGKVITQGSAVPNTGVPGNIGGYTKERIIRASADGTFTPNVSIGDVVEKDAVVAAVDGHPIFAQISGVIRGILPSGTTVHTGMKAGDIDPRNVVDHCWSISDKARAVAGGVLEAILYLNHQEVTK